MADKYRIKGIWCTETKHEKCGGLIYNQRNRSIVSSETTEPVKCECDCHK